MIYDTFENAGLYFKANEPFRQALDFAASFDLSQPDGRYEIDGDNLFAIVMSYETKATEELKFEAHKKYADMQLLLHGEEFMDVSLSKDLPVEKTYSEEGDCALFKAPEAVSSVLLRPGYFAVAYPEYLHQPGRMVKAPSKVRKMVVKVRV